MSRGQTARWMLEEVGEPYETKIVDYGTTMKAEPYLSINPMGKVPAIVHKGKVVTEVAAICCYLADAFPEQEPRAARRRERADYYRWIFFTSARSRPRSATRRRAGNRRRKSQRMFGYGNYDLAIATLEKAVSDKEYIAADHFTAADLFVGANINFMLAFNLLDPRPAFVDYARRMTDRPAYGARRRSTASSSPRSRRDSRNRLK